MLLSLTHGLTSINVNVIINNGINFEDCEDYMFDGNGFKFFLHKCLNILSNPIALGICLVLLVIGAFALMPVMINGGGSDVCKMWRYHDGTKPADISVCCSEIEKIGDLTGAYLEVCCNDSDFAKTSSLCKKQEVEEVVKSSSVIKKDAAKKTGVSKLSCDKTKITVSCAGKHLSTMTNGVYDSVVTCKVEGCLPGYYAVISGTDSNGAYNLKLSNGESKTWTAKFGGKYDNPNQCRSCAIVRANDEVAVKWESPCTGGNMSYVDGKWGGGDKGHINCSVTYEK